MEAVIGGKDNQCGVHQRFSASPADTVTAKQMEREPDHRPMY